LRVRFGLGVVGHGPLTLAGPRATGSGSGATRRSESTRYPVPGTLLVVHQGQMPLRTRPTTEACYRRLTPATAGELLAQELVLERDTNLGGDEVEDLDLLDRTVELAVVGVDHQDHPIGPHHREDRHL